MGKIVKTGLAISSLVTLSGFLAPIYITSVCNEMDKKTPELKRVAALESEMLELAGNEKPLSLARKVIEDRDFEKESGGLVMDYADLWQQPRIREAQKEKEDYRSTSGVYSSLLKGVGAVALGYFSLLYAISRLGKKEETPVVQARH